MCKVARITGDQAVKAFGRAGFHLDRVKGSHHILKREGFPHRLSLPVHAGKTVGMGLLKTQIAGGIDDKGIPRSLVTTLGAQATPMVSG